VNLAITLIENWPTRVDDPANRRSAHPLLWEAPRGAALKVIELPAVS
jgi:hypothetical protein